MAIEKTVKKIIRKNSKKIKQVKNIHIEINVIEKKPYDIWWIKTISERTNKPNNNNQFINRNQSNRIWSNFQNYVVF